MSTHPDLVKKSIDKLSLNTPSANTAGFNSVESVAGKKTDANIYINIPYFTLAVWKTVSETEKDNLVRYARFADWSGLDLLVKKDELLLTGYTSITDSTFHTLALFAHQAPQKMDAVTILPDNVNSFTLFGFENFGMFLKRAVYDNPESPGTVNHLAPFNRRYDLNAESWFLPWIGSQLGNATTEPEGSTENVITYTFIQTAFPDSARRSLVSLAAKLGRKTDTSNFKGYPIVETSLKDALGAVFGNLFRNVNGECFTIIGNFVIFADREEDLKDIVDHFISGTTLAMQKSYIELSDDISEKANIYFYCRPGKALNQSPSLFSEPIHKSMQPWLDSLAKFETLTLQFSYNEGRYYTDLSLRFNPNPRDEGPLAWESTLDTLMAGSPQIIARDIKGTAGIIVTDTLNNIYLFDAAGNRLWKQKLYGRILGSVIPVELIDDDSLYYMFNTANHLYLVRSDGETAEKFPMKFPVQASNGVTLTDYNNNGDFRIIIAFKDNRVYNFTIDGTQAEGWVRPQMENEILKPVQYLEYDHKDYLFITDVKGNTMITDRRGTQRIKPVRPVITGENTQFFLNKTARKGPFLTTDHTGKIIFIQENGKISASTVNQFTPGYTFSYEDLKGESSPDFIFFDKNTLYYYDKLMKLTYSYKFLHDVGEPRIIRTLNGKVYIGVISGKGRDIFIFDRNGLVETEPSIRGTTPFDMGNITGKTELNLVIGAGLKLKMYRLTQF
jgi:outer membrane protein assembly factor BamB